MTGAQMVTQWIHDFDVLASQASPGFLTSEILLLLNEAYELTILDLYHKKDWVSLQALINDVTYPNSNYPLGLGQIGLTASLNLDGTVIGYWAYLPGFAPGNGDTNPVFWLYIDSHTAITRTAQPSTGFAQLLTGYGQFTQNTFLTIPEFHNQVTTTWNKKRIFKTPYCTLNTNTINIIVDDYSTPVGYAIIYVRKYVSITNSGTIPELNEGFHQLIVKLAVQLGMQVTHSKEPLKQ